ncbi:MAG: hypothetical protein J5682_04600 [Prevotella sp.]|nr:hypothetical protein [Prevotella sp.]
MRLQQVLSLLLQVMIFMSLPVSAGNDIVFLGSNSFQYRGVTYPLDQHHLLVDGTRDDANAHSNPYVYSDFREAMDHVIDGTPEQPMTVFIAPDVYWVDDPDDPTVAVGKNGREPFGMVVRCQYLHLIGLSPDAHDVVLASQRGQTQGAVGNFTMFDFWGDGLQVTNLTMGNYCNIDLVYPLNPQKNRPRRSSAITQAHVAYCHGDKTVARNVRFVSRLNMNPLNGPRRVFYDDCHFECTDDAMTGNGVYLHCEFEFYGQKPFYTTHHAGAVLLDCDIYLMGESRQHYFCKQAGPLTLIDCRFHSVSKEVSIGWAPYPSPSLRCYQSGVTLNGKPLTIEGKHAGVTVNIDNKKLLQYFRPSKDVYQVNALLAGDDGWAPVEMDIKTDVRPFSTCMKVYPERDTVRAGEGAITLTTRQMRHGGYAALDSRPVSWTVQPDLADFITIDVQDNGSCRVSSTYDGDDLLSCCITATTDEGLEGAAVLILKGSDLPAPAWRAAPKIIIEADSAHLVYSYTPVEHRDESVITWYLAPDKTGTGAIPVAVSHDGPEKGCKLKPEYQGKYLMASIRPRHARSPFGETRTVIYPRPLASYGENKDWVVETDFHDFPCKWQPLVKEGFWTVDGFKPDDTAEYPWSFDRTHPMWEYGEGFNGAVGRGLLQAQRGARLMYTPLTGDYGDMEVKLDVDPTKTAGQGFGSATGQYMDVCLKFDTRTLSGYGLRIIRTVKYAKAVDFYLVRYDQGKVTPLTEPVSATCYRTGCHIVVRYTEGVLTALISTDTPLSQPDDPALQTTVSLKAAVEASSFGGFCLQHTGSCGESTTMLHHLRMTTFKHSR